MNKKSQAGIPTTVRVVGLAIALLALILVSGVFVQYIFGAVKTGECQWDLLFSAIATVAGGGAMDVPPECKAEYITITKKDLEKELDTAAARIKTYDSNPEKYRKIRQAGFKYYKDEPEKNYKVQMEWALNKIIADKMLSCWKKVWKGSLPMFDYWWKLVDWTWFGLSKKEYTQDEINKVGGEVDLGVFSVYGPPAFCIVCYHLNFDKDVRGLFQEDIKSLNVWMAGNKAPNSDISYLEELQEGQTLESKFWTPQYEYNIQKPLGIVYKRLNPQALNVVKAWVLDKLVGYETAKAVNILALADYDLIATPVEKDRVSTGGLGCFYVID